MIRIGKITISNQSAPVLYDDREERLFLSSVNDLGFNLLSSALKGPIQGILELNARKSLNIVVLSATVNLFSETVACKARPVPAT